MICQRPANKARGLLWEFVGGKVEPGETKEQALIRECQEELAITLDVGEVFMDVVHEYPDLTVHLTLFNSSIRAGIPQKLEHNDIRWITVDEIDQSLRIYTDFSAETQRLFSADIEQASPECAVVCIVDNYMSGANRAKEVIEVISEKCSTTRRNIIGSIFSSKEMYEEISDKLYFEYASKEKPEELKSCIARSAYNYFISELKNETLVSMSTAFDKALKNKGIAFFLAQKARSEGASEYEIINDWIRLLATTPREDANTIKRMIRLSRVINSLEDTEELPDADLQKLNTLEAFDYTINDYFLPVAAGDVFTNSKDEWFVLIGQDCDMARSITRTPKNALAELLPAKVRHQTQFDKWANDLRSASIYSFRKTLGSECEVLQVEYQNRQYIANEVLNLCSFNSDGQCIISEIILMDAMIRTANGRISWPKKSAEKPVVCGKWSRTSSFVLLFLMIRIC